MMSLILMTRRVMMNNSDAEDLLDDLEELINTKRYGSPDDLLFSLDEFVRVKRSEFAEPQGDCCG